MTSLRSPSFLQNFIYTTAIDHPVCAASEASRLFFRGAATPPHEEGNLAPLIPLG